MLLDTVGAAAGAALVSYLVFRRDKIKTKLHLTKSEQSCIVFGIKNT